MSANEIDDAMQQARRNTFEFLLNRACSEALLAYVDKHGKVPKYTFFRSIEGLSFGTATWDIMAGCGDELPGDEDGFYDMEERTLEDVEELRQLVAALDAEDAVLNKEIDLG